MAATDWPTAVRAWLVDWNVSMQWLRIGLEEAKNVEQVYDEVRNAGSLPDVPLIVLCSMGTDDFKRAVSMGESEVLLQRDRRQATALRAIRGVRLVAQSSSPTVC